MIFVALGTQRNPFVRFLSEIELMIEECNIQEVVIVQRGHTQYNSNKFKSFDYICESEFDKYISKASVFITHAGAGALYHAIKKGKKIIAFPRLIKYGEMIDNHQTELAKKLSEEGYIIDGSISLKEAWKDLQKFTPRKYDFKNDFIPKLKYYLDSLDV